jgi:predicted ABC-type ATPase
LLSSMTSRSFFSWNNSSGKTPVKALAKARSDSKEKAIEADEVLRNVNRVHAIELLLCSPS